ncbi:MAG: M23 family metallopeptidase [Deltaproteobacteria bacterium]|nr:M23 family metallopeptidase [Deltaproteobacteria bacterium]
MARINKYRGRSSSRRGRGLGTKILFTLLILFIAAGAVVGFILFETEKPQLLVDKEIKFLGGPVEIPFKTIDQKSGIKQVVITLEQDGGIFQLFHKSFPRQAWLSKAGPGEVTETISLDAKRAGAKEGKAELVITINDFSLNGMLKGNASVARFPVSIDTKPPRVTIEHAQRYIMPGGSGIVVYGLSEPSLRHGVMIDSTLFQGYPLQGSDKRYIAYIGLPWNSSKPENTRVIAVDQAGNEGKAVFSMNFKKPKEKKDRINISDGFLKKKLPEFQEHYPEMKGSDIDRYLIVNRKIRISNAEQIAEICSNTVSEQLWQDRFIRMPGAGKAGFADQRTYYYKNEPIDHQTHLGMDIASTARVAIKAANSGKVIFAEYLGIYGNTVILDHGQGLSSLYSHLSSIDTKPGNMVNKDEVIGKSGTTGMAGGDHLHFSMLVHGIFVTPIEWWDQHWIDVNINNVINDSQL